MTDSLGSPEPAHLISLSVLQDENLMKRNRSIVRWDWWLSHRPAQPCRRIILSAVKGGSRFRPHGRTDLQRICNRYSALPTFAPAKAYAR